MRIYIQIILFTVFLFELGACVSVDIKPKGPTRSKFYTVETPADPFESFENDQADQAWRNPNTGNSIAVISECTENGDPDLKTIENDSITALTNPEILQTTRTRFADREAYRTLAQGTVDGILVKMDLLTFKKSSCVYTLSSIGRDKVFDKDRKAFDAFIKGFKLP